MQRVGRHACACAWACAACGVARALAGVLIGCSGRLHLPTSISGAPAGCVLRPGGGWMGAIYHLSSTHLARAWAAPPQPHYAYTALARARAARAFSHQATIQLAYGRGPGALFEHLVCSACGSTSLVRSM